MNLEYKETKEQRKVPFELSIYPDLSSESVPSVCHFDFLELFSVVNFEPILVHFPL